MTTRKELLELFARAKDEGWQVLDKYQDEDAKNRELLLEQERIAFYQEMLDTWGIPLRPGMTQALYLEYLVPQAQKSRNDSLETSDLIKLAQEESWSRLDLSGRCLNGLPTEIFELTQLECLILGLQSQERGGRKKNRIKYLPSEIKKLSRLKTLSLADNQIEELPNEIGELSSLEELDLTSNHVRELPQAFRELSRLSLLSLWNNEIGNLPDTLGELSNLKFLILGFNKITSLPRSIGELESLRSLNLLSNRVSQVPQEINNIRGLETVVLSENLLDEIPEEILDLSSLKELYFSHSGLTQIPPSIERLKKLRTLFVPHNLLSELPAKIQDMESLEELYLHGNPISIPPEVLISEPDENGFRQVGDLQTIFRLAFTPSSETYPLHESKLLIVGDGGAGKTSLANKLQDPEYQLKPEEKSTEGIDLIRWEIDYDPETKLRTNIWDFGGQQIYHSTHQFFLTERAVYILVADTRKENTDFYYWLRTIETLGGDSPVIIVKNEKQDRKCDLDERSLRAEFLNLKEIHAVNLADNRGLGRLQTLLQTYLCNLPHIGTRVPIPWANIRAVLENLSHNQNFITQERYFELCRNNGFTDEKDMLAASKFLHDLGICLHFQKVRGLRKLIILKPTWATGSIYKILDNPEIKADFGRFSYDDLAEIWNSGDAARMRDELLDLMMHFGLCYEIPLSRGRYISPQLLEKESCDYDWDDAENLILSYEYEFKPKDIFPRFVVATHELIERQELDNQSFVWRHGVILHDRSARAEIIEEDRYHKATIRVRVSGHHKRDLLTYIARELERISNTYDRIDYETNIPCNCNRCKTSPEPHTYTWENLRRRLQHKQYEVQCDISYQMVNVRSLLDDIAAPMPPSASDELDRSGLERDRYGDPTGRSSPFSPTVVFKYENPQQVMGNTGRTIHTGGGNYVETNVSGSGQYAEGNIVNGGTSITQNHSGSGDNVAGDKNVTHNPEPKTPAEAAKEIQDLLAQLELTAEMPERRINNRIAKQDLDWQQRLWNALKNASPEVIKSVAALALAPVSPTTAGVAALNIIVEGVRGALEDAEVISEDEPELYDRDELAKLIDL